MDKAPSLHIIPLTQDGITPLYAASLKGHREVVDILTSNGADVDLASEVCLVVYTIPYVYCTTAVIPRVDLCPVATYPCTAGGTCCYNTAPEEG